MIPDGIDGNVIWLRRVRLIDTIISPVVCSSGYRYACYYYQECDAHQEFLHCHDHGLPFYTSWAAVIMTDLTDDNSPVERLKSARFGLYIPLEASVYRLYPGICHSDIPPVHTTFNICPCPCVRYWRVWGWEKFPIHIIEIISHPLLTDLETGTRVYYSLVANLRWIVQFEGESTARFCTDYGIILCFIYRQVLSRY